jgi:hypothetical protein
MLVANYIHLLLSVKRKTNTKVIFNLNHPDKRRCNYMWKRTKYEIMKKEIILMLFWSVLYSTVFAQYTTDKVVGQKNAQIIDSLKTAEYPYLFPIWGKKVAQKGFKLPKSAGLSVQYLWQKSDIIINNLQVGFNNGPKYNLDEIVRFDKAQTVFLWRCRGRK